VLDEDGRSRAEVVLQSLAFGQEAAHAEQAGRAGPAAAPQAEGQGQGTALGEPGHDRLRPVEAVLGAGRIEQVIEGVNRRDEFRPASRDAVGFVPLPAAHEGERRPGQHREKPAFGVEVGNQRLEVMLVGALAVDQHEQPVGFLPAPHHIGHQRRGHRRTLPVPIM
jgi:hypothetical protein